MRYLTTVVSTWSKLTTSGFTHYAASTLACGHQGTCEMKPTIYECGGCGHRQIEFAKCKNNCGYKGGFKFAFLPDPRRVEDRLTQIGDEQECRTCKSHSEDAQRLRELSEPVFRARYSERWGGQYHLYRRDESSPSGVMLITTVGACPEVELVLREKRISPLSPTEGRAR